METRANKNYNHNNQVKPVWDKIAKKKYQEGLNLLSNMSFTHPVDKWIPQARCEEGLKQYDQAVKSYMQIPNWQKNPSVLLPLARCYQEMEKYDEAIITYRKIPNLDNHFEGLYCLARCYDENDQDDNALEIHTRIRELFSTFKNIKQKLKWLLTLARFYEKKEIHAMVIKIHQEIESIRQGLSKISPAVRKILLNIVLSQGRYYQKLGQFIVAIKYFQSMGEEDIQGALGVARCYSEMGRFHEALKILLRIENISNSEKEKTDILIAIARCYEDMGQFGNTIQYFEKISNWNENKKALLGIARCYEMIGNYNKAIENFKKIKNWKFDREALLGIVHCHEAMSEYDKALEYLNDVQAEEDDTQVSIIRGHIYQAQDQYDMALDAFRKSKKWKTNPPALLAIGRCYSKMGDHRTAIQYFIALLEFDKNHFQAKLAIAHCYEYLNQKDKAYNSFSLLAKQFPNNYEARYHYCRYLIEINNEEVASEINEAIKRWNYQPGLYFLKARYAQLYKPKELFDVLIEGKLQFPYHSKFYLKLIYNYLLNGDFSNANKIKEECSIFFPEVEKLFFQIDRLFYLPRLLLPLAVGNEEIVADEKLEIMLPDAVQKIFDLNIPGEHYFVGSKLIQLIIEQKNIQGIDTVNMGSDIDFISTCVNEDLLSKHGFIKNPHVPNLYKNFHSMVDFYRVSPCDSLKEYALESDFTITALYYKVIIDDSTGYRKYKIYDPTGLGTHDLRKQTLRMIGNPLVRFNEDPILILRAINYINLGFKPLSSIQNALKEWKLEYEYLDQETFQHLCAVACKYLTRANGHRYFMYLKEYGLLTKIFSIASNATIQDTILILQGRRDSVAIDEYSTMNNNMMFFQTTKPSRDKYANFRSIQVGEIKHSVIDRLNLEQSQNRKPTISFLFAHQKVKPPVKPVIESSTKKSYLAAALTKK